MRTGRAAPRTSRIVWLAAALPLLVLAANRSRAATDTSPSFAILHASVVPMDAERVLRDQVILVVGDRIAAVGPPEQVAIPAEAAIVDVRGAYVLPGLIDMHVHVRRADLRAYVDNGITSVRNMWGFQTLPTGMAEIAAGRLLGPTIYSASPGLDGTPAVWPETRIVDDPRDADAAVADQVAAGWRFIKVYNSLSLASYDAIVAAAKARGIRFVGHVPNAVRVEHALDSGQASIEHLRGYDLALALHPVPAQPFAAWTDIDASRIPALADRTAASGTWNCPTLTILELISRGQGQAAYARAIQNRAAMLRALRDAGAGLLAGTDAGIEKTAAGSSLHEELADFVAAGLTPYEALRAATSDAARFLEEEAEIGQVAPRLRADLLVLASNPLDDIGATRAIEAVVLRGAWRPLDGSRSPLVRPAAPRAHSPRSLERDQP